jgi:hypothetical protein
MPKEPKRTLYVHRRLLNADELIGWAHGEGFKKTLPARDMHVTVAFSRGKVLWSDMEHIPGRVRIKAGSTGRKVQRLGDKGAIVLRFRSALLTYRWKEFRDIGCSWDWEGYKPHVTLSYQGDGVRLRGVMPYEGELLFGREEFSEVEEDWEKGVKES